MCILTRTPGCSRELEVVRARHASRQVLTSFCHRCGELLESCTGGVVRGVYVSPHCIMIIQACEENATSCVSFFRDYSRKSFIAEYFDTFFFVEYSTESNTNLCCEIGGDPKDVNLDDTKNLREGGYSPRSAR